SVRTLPGPLLDALMLKDGGIRVRVSRVGINKRSRPVPRDALTRPDPRPRWSCNRRPKNEATDPGLKAAEPKRACWVRRGASRSPDTPVRVRLSGGGRQERQRK